MFNFTTGYSILNVLNEEEVLGERFERVRGSLRFALMEEELMYLQLSASVGKPINNANPNTASLLLCGDSLISWLESISDDRCF